MGRMIGLSVVLLLMMGVGIGPASADDLQVSGPYPGATFTYQSLEEGKVLISAMDAEENPILGMTRDEFVIRRGSKTAHILSVEPLSTSKDVGLNVVLVLDNSYSMRLRNAIEPLVSALEYLYQTFRPIDQVSVVVFDERDTMTIEGRALRARVMQTSDIGQLRDFVRESMSRRNLTEGTYLYEAMLVGAHLARQMPPTGNKFMVVFSDGEDINSRVTQGDVKKAVQGIDNLAIYAVDYMPSPVLDPYLKGLTGDFGGKAWKAGSAAELLPVFQAFSSTLMHRYVVSYRFVQPPSGTLAFADSQLTIEELTTIDSAPLLNQVFFDTGQSQIVDRYVLFTAREQTAAFDERQLRDGMEKHRHVLNIIGKRMQDNPDASIRLVGCNSDTGEEKGRLDLSRGRAEAVRAYLHYVWGIAPNRIVVEQRNLPAAPSNVRIPEGRADNQRVEILSDHPAILDTVNSEYVTKISDMKELRVVPRIQAEAGVAEWQLTFVCGDRNVKTVIGRGALPEEWRIPLTSELLEEFAACDRIDARIIGKDNEGNPLDSRSAQGLAVNFIQRTQRMAQVQGYRVKEQYALILFDFDSAAIKERNEAIVVRIIARMREVPDAVVFVVGHTDNIGSEAYNLNLSERRAKAVQQALVKASAPGADRMLVSGAGPNAPQYDNALPEGRALNRTVTITLEYFQQP